MRCCDDCLVVAGGAAHAPADKDKKRKKLKRQQRGAGKRECSVGMRMQALLKVLVTSATEGLTSQSAP